MSDKNEQLGTIIHGIGSSAHLDSSGERIEIQGIDISSLEETGVINYEHESKTATQIVGKIIEATKILSEKDIKNKHHRKFWKLAKETPYLYIKAVLFDEFGHNGAQDVAAILRFDQALDKKDTKILSGFSVEGSKLDIQNKVIKKCIARKVSFTITPCNKACVAEILEPEAKDKETINLASIVASFKKSEELENDLNKGSLQRRLGSPKKHVSNKERSTSLRWTGGEVGRDDIPSMDNNARQRILHKLHSQTQVKKHPKTGERMFLMHRGVSGNINNRVPHEFNTTSWTPHESVAENFAIKDDDTGYPSKGFVRSMWIPESHIHNYPNNSTGDKDAPEYQGEHEYLVKPLKNSKAIEAIKYKKTGGELSNARINERNNVKNMGDEFDESPQETQNKLQDFNRDYKKLAASEGENNDLNKIETPKYNANLGFKAQKKPESKTRDYKPATPNQGQTKAGASWKPTQTISASNISSNDKLGSGTRISYQGQKPLKGKDIYNNPDTWKKEMGYMSNSRKAILKACKNLGTLSLTEDSITKNEVLRVLSQEAFDIFPHKEFLLESVKKSLPNASEQEVMAIAKTYAYKHMKKIELKLSKLVEDV